MKFDGLASSNFTIAKYLAKENDVYYIEHPLTLKDYLKLSKKSDAYKIRRSGLNIFSDGLLSQKIDGVNIIVSLLVLPSQSLKNQLLLRMFTWINQKLAIKRIRKVIQKKNITDYIFINAYDFKYPDIGSRLNPELAVYYCVDPIPDYDRPFGVMAEEKLVKLSDIVICTSKALCEEKKLLNKNTYFVPNGADIVNSNKVGHIQKHVLAANIQGPVIGYIGAIERRIDFKLIDYITERLTDYTFLFVGPLYKEYVPAWFFERKNIVYIQPIPYHEVPEMIKAFDVCMIPFKKDEISRNIFPLKLFEYLGMGKPVVATDFNIDLAEFSEDLVTYNADAASFLHSIQVALAENNTDLKKRRMEVASRNIWSERADRIMEIIESHLYQ